MIDTHDLCINCFAKKGKTRECSRCGYVDGTPQVAPFLAPGTIIGERFIVGKHESLTGEGATYLGYDMQNNDKVVIREYLPLTLCTREAGNDNVKVNDGEELTYADYLQDFFDISKAVSRLSDVPAIVPVRAIFECNNTAYTVYDKPDGRPLTDIVKKAKRLTWEEARPLFLPLVAAMNSAHSLGLVHFGISPETVYFNRDRKLHLTSFAIPDSRMTETPLKAELFDGFSAVEQYSAEGKRGKASDVYSICALMYYALTGKRPADAVKRAYEPRLNVPSELAESIPSHVLAAIAGGLQVMPDNRIQTMEELRSQLSLKGGASANPAPQQRPAAPASTPARRPVQPRPAAQQRRTAPASNKNVSIVDRLGEFGKLKQWQYWLLSTIISMIVLGIIAIVILNIFKPYIARDDSNKIKPAPTFVYSNSDISDAKTYEVPNLVGKKWESIKNDTESEYYYFHFVCLADTESSEDYKEGEIIKQVPAAGGELIDGGVVSLTISAGANTVKIPKIIGKTIYEAQQMLDKVELKIGEQTSEYSDKYAFGQIIEITDQKEGDKVPIESYLNVVVSAGKAPENQIIDE